MRHFVTLTCTRLCSVPCKSIQFAKPAYVHMCFVDLKQAFDKVRLGDVIVILQEKGISKLYLDLIKDINS
jgi:hypothetical protein